MESRDKDGKGDFDITFGKTLIFFNFASLSFKFPPISYISRDVFVLLCSFSSILLFFLSNFVVGDFSEFLRML